MIPIRKAVIAWDVKSKRIVVLFQSSESKSECWEEFRRLGMTRDIGPASMEWNQRPTGYLAAQALEVGFTLICRHGFDSQVVYKELSKINELNDVLNKGEHMNNALSW